MMKMIKFGNVGIEKENVFNRDRFYKWRSKKDRIHSYFYYCERHVLYPS